MLYIIITVAVITFLSLVYFSFKHRQRYVHRRRHPSVEAHPSRPFSKRTIGDPEERYVQGVGYIIGDLSCSYNARSPYIRCAVNPSGLCQDCRHYHNRDDN